MLGSASNEVRLKAADCVGAVRAEVYLDAPRSHARVSGCFNGERASGSNWPSSCQWPYFRKSSPSKLSEQGPCN